MSNLIHLDPDQTRNSILQNNTWLDSIEDALVAINNQIRAIPWEGNSRELFVRDFSANYRHLLNSVQQGRILFQRVQREVDEWVSVDNQGGVETASIATILTGISNGIRKTFGDLMREYDTLQMKKEFNEWWQERTDDEKKEYLNKQYKKITEDLGLDPMDVQFIDIDDPKGKDARGYYNGVGIFIDSDNLKSDKPWDLLDTLAHETRHQYQFHSVETWKQTGELPKGISKETIESWESNIKDYITPEDDFEGYRSQPIEVDSRDYGGDFSKNAISSKSWMSS